MGRQKKTDRRLWWLLGISGGVSVLWLLGTVPLVGSTLDEEGKAPVDVTTPHAFFNGTDKDLDWRTKRNSDEFTFGWALTVHKSQGSSWDNVLLFDESGVFRDDARKWLYTGVTRAAEKITVIL
jgi:exodeoxyribonuclease-5